MLSDMVGSRHVEKIKGFKKGLKSLMVVLTIA